MSNKLNKTIGKIGRELKKASPTILSCVAIVGTGAVSVSTAKATFKTVTTLNELKEKTENPTKLDIVKATWKNYIHTAIITTGTICCIAGSNLINKKQQASLIGAYTMLNQGYKQYVEGSKAVFGDDAERQIKAEMAKKTYISACGCEVIYDPDHDDSDEKLFYDSFSSRYFTATLASVINAEYHFSRNMALRGYVTLNEFYDFLGLDEVEGGDISGWDLEYMMEGGLIWLDFDNNRVELEDGLECYQILTTLSPSILEDYI